jgi:hypothetical protein
MNFSFFTVLQVEERMTWQHHELHAVDTKVVPNFLGLWTAFLSQCE